MLQSLRSLPSAAVIALAAMLAGCSSGTETEGNAAVCRAFDTQSSAVEVVAEGDVTRVLGVRAGRTSPHQGFLVRLDSTCAVVVRVEANTDFTGTMPIRPGARVAVKGEYEFDSRGGVIHWTHRDPRGRHEGGYVRVGGQYYQ
ncbi:MAG: DUF3465 domain-containing protein [Vulcanimicrobiaceae bacterium]